MILGLDELHSRNILHKNLKSSNILIDKNGRIQLSDIFIFNDNKINYAISESSSPEVTNIIIYIYKLYL